MASLLPKLLSFLNRVFDKDPHQFLAFRVDYTGSALTWTVADATLTLASDDGFVDLVVPLAGYTIATLAAFLAQQNSLTLGSLPNDGTQNLSALVLIEGTNSSDSLNGDDLYAYTSLLWAYQSAVAQELTLCGAAIAALPLEMSTTTADGGWLDFLGAFYNVPRLLAEPDATYGPRIIAEVIFPLTNGPAIAQAIQNTVGQVCRVVDVIEWGPAVPQYNNTIIYNAAYEHDASAEPIYNLFDVSVGYDIINGADPATFYNIVKAQVERIRAAGTQMRNLVITSSEIGDTFTPPTDLKDSMAVSRLTLFNGVRKFDGSVPFFTGGPPVLSAISG
jgi:hypothetical protein